MITIHKYPLNVPEKPGDARIEFHIAMPLDAKILHADVDPIGQLCVWALVDTEIEEKEIRKIRIFGTGRECNLPTSKYIKSVVQGIFVWHIFEG